MEYGMTLRQTLRTFNIEEGFVQIIQTFYNSASSVILMNNQIGDFFQTKTGVTKGCILSPIHLASFLRQYCKGNSLNVTPVDLCGKFICNLWFAADMDLLRLQISCFHADQR